MIDNPSTPPSKPDRVKLGDLLTDKQMRRIKRIMKTKDSSKRIMDLKAYLRGFAAELEAKGVNSDYLSYFLEYILCQKQQSEEVDH